MPRGRGDVLLVAATEHELGGHEGLICGIGPVEAAAVTALAIVRERPRAVVNVGLAGGRGIGPRTLVIGTEAYYHDLRAGIPVVSKALPDAALLENLRGALPEAELRPIVTSAMVGGDHGDPEVEAMEGFAVLRACALAEVPAIEVRAISNEIGEADRLRWDIAGALRALGGAIPRLLEGLG
ncbi:MAG: hypothetical protein U0R50_00905 [Gaiellales bacterium]